MLDNTKKRNQRVAASLRRIQAQVAAIERSLAGDPDGGMLLQRVAAARTAMSGLMTYLMEERLRSLQPDCDGSDAMEEIIEIVRDYLTAASVSGQNQESHSDLERPQLHRGDGAPADPCRDILKTKRRPRERARMRKR